MEFYNEDQEQNIPENEGQEIISEREYQNLVNEKHDEFLDLYVEYLEDQDMLTKKILKRKMLDLEAIDPNFQFTID